MILPTLRETVEKAQHGGAIAGYADNFLTQIVPERLNQVQIGRTRQQKHLANRFVSQLGSQILIFVVASVVIYDAGAGCVGVSCQ